MNRSGCPPSAASRCRSRWCRSDWARRGARSRPRPRLPVAPGRPCCGAPRMATLSSRTAGTGFSMPHSSGSPIRNRSPSVSTLLQAWSSTACSLGSRTRPCLPARAAYASSSGVEPVSSEEEVLMFASLTLRAPCAVTLALGLAVALGIGAADAQQHPSASAIAAAKEVITAKGAAALYSPLVSGVIERTKSIFLQTNPMLGKDLNEVAAKLHAEYATRSAEIVNDVAKLYASRFTEQELKDILAFYKSPLGRKLIVEEPAILDQSMKNAQVWAENLSQEVIAKMRTEMKKRGHDI